MIIILTLIHFLPDTKITKAILTSKYLLKSPIVKSEY